MSRCGYENLGFWAEASLRTDMPRPVVGRLYLLKAETETFAHDDNFLVCSTVLFSDDSLCEDGIICHLVILVTYLA